MKDKFLKSIPCDSIGETLFSQFKISLVKVQEEGEDE